jgi:hypothetical protein
MAICVHYLGCIIGSLSGFRPRHRQPYAIRSGQPSIREDYVDERNQGLQE